MAKSQGKTRRDKSQDKARQGKTRVERLHAAKSQGKTRGDKAQDKARQARHGKMLSMAIALAPI